jgi:HAD superfamily hydrolase (TIGR01509 family)
VPETNIDAVAFDLDGLMINSEALYRESGSQMIRRRGKQPEEAVFLAMMGRPNRDALQVLKIWYGFSDSIEDLNRETDELMNVLLAERLQTMPGLIELLEAIETAQIPRAVATSASRPYLDRVLNQLALAGRFQFALTAENVTHGKPHPEVYVTAAQRFEVVPTRMLVLEDSNHGCTAAVAAGAITVAVPTEHTGALTADVHLVAENLADRRIYELLGL